MDHPVPEEKVNRVFFVKHILANFHGEIWQIHPVKHRPDAFPHLDDATPHRATRSLDRGDCKTSSSAKQTRSRTMGLLLFGTFEKNWKDPRVAIKLKSCLQ
jgi:hypothetical protein